MSTLTKNIIIAALVIVTLPITVPVVMVALEAVTGSFNISPNLLPYIAVAIILGVYLLVRMFSSSGKQSVKVSSRWILIIFGCLVVVGILIWIYLAWMLSRGSGAFPL